MFDLGVYMPIFRVWSGSADDRSAAGEQRDLLLRHAERIQAEIAAQHTRLNYLREKAALWDARARSDAAAEAKAQLRVTDAYHCIDIEMGIKR